MIKLENINKSFDGKKVLKNINLEIQKGEIFGIIGLSGAGKSTLIRLINQLERQDSGNIYVNNVNISNLDNNKLREFRKKTAMIFQHFSLLSSRTVYENIKLPLEISKNVNEEKINKMLKLVDLYDKKDEYVNKLSGGQKQRVAIARALCLEPSILLSDEATSALDPITANNILDLLKKINKELNITIVLITHQMEVIKKICDKVAVLKEGEIIEYGSTNDIFLESKTEFTKSLINSLSSEIPKSKTWILHFGGNYSEKSYISIACKKFGVDINVLGGNIHTLSNNEKIGYLMVQFDEKHEQMLTKWFLENNIKVEVLL